MSRLLAVLLLAAVPGGTRAATPRNDLPAAPADHIYDDARLFDESSRARLGIEIHRLKEQADVQLYVAAYTLLRENIDDHARRLRETWGEGPRTVVLVYRRGSHQMTFSANGDPEVFIPSGELHSIYDMAVAAAREYEAPADRIEAAIRSLSHSLIRDLTRRDAQRGGLGSDVIKLTGLFVLIALTGGGIALLLGRRIRARQEARGSGTTFPEVVVGRRLGAPFGGGTVAEIDYSRPSSTPRVTGAVVPEAPPLPR